MQQENTNPQTKMPWSRTASICEEHGIRIIGRVQPSPSLQLYERDSQWENAQHLSLKKAQWQKPRAQSRQVHCVVKTPDFVCDLTGKDRYTWNETRRSITRNVLTQTAPGTFTTTPIPTYIIDAPARGLRANITNLSHKSSSFTALLQSIRKV